MDIIINMIIKMSFNLIIYYCYYY